MWSWEKLGLGFGEDVGAVRGDFALLARFGGGGWWRRQWWWVGSNSYVVRQVGMWTGVAINGPGPGP